MVEVADAPTSFILLEELFEAGDDRFLTEIFGCIDDKKLKALATKWYRDRRPWARKVLLAYVDDGCDRPRHRALVKALLRLAESNDDDELMAHFLFAFDRLVKRELKLVRRYDWYARQMREHRMRVQVYPDPKRDHSPGAWKLRQKAPKGDWRFQAPWFSATTRQYLKRRAYRWFRQLAYREPERYRAGLLKAMSLYTDAHLSDPVNILDAYGLTNLLFYGAGGVLSRTSRSLTVRGGTQLAELEPAPRNPDALRGHAEGFLRLLFRSDSILIRRWIVGWLEREEADALRGIDARKLKPLLLSHHGDVALFAARLLESAEGLGTFAVDDWLELLDLNDPEVVPIVCGLVREHVTPDRLDFAALVRLAGARPLPVAELGFEWLKERAPEDADALHLAMSLADAPCEPVREQATRWLLGFVTSELGEATHLRDLIDARHEDVRRLALSVMGEEERFRDDPTLWTALAESPYPDVLHHLVRHLEEREASLPKERVEHAWATTLLSVHRGSRAKRHALRQIAARVVADPDRAEALLPILRVGLRSVREAERRSALAAVARAAFENPDLRDAITEHVPELALFDREARA